MTAAEAVGDEREAAAAGASVTLERLLERRGRLDPATVLDIAVALARLAHARHRAGELLSGPLHPRCVRVELRGGETSVELEAPAADPPPLEAAAFSAPELTGRMDPSAVIDERTDLYRIGVLLYTALAGSPPFSGGALIEMVHAHLAKRPPPLRAAPRALEAIVDRLLEKSPAARYQSAFGLLHDLLRCRRLLREGGGEAATGTPCVILISGPPGAGKTFLAREIGRRAVAQGIASRLIAGKADQYSAVPYAVISRCLEDLAGQARRPRPRPAPLRGPWRAALGGRQLAASRKDAPLWRGALLRALQGNAALIADVAPATRLILGSDLPPVGELPPGELQARLRAGIEAFVRVAVAGPSPAPGARLAPLLLLSDDIQWIDADGFKVSTVRPRPARPARLPPGAPPDAGGRDRSSSPPTSPSSCWRRRARGPARGRPRPPAPGGARARVLELLRPSVTVLDLALGPLRREDYRQLVSHALKEGGEGLVDALAGVLEARSGGNPLHAVQLLRALCEQRALRFEHEAGRWEWDEARAEAAGEGAGLLDAFTAALLALPAPSRHALQVASCCGPRFDVETLGTVLGVPAEEAAGRLRAALAARLLVPREGPAPGALSFRHDRIQQAAHELLEPGERAALCLRAGLLLRASRPDLPASEALYEAALVAVAEVNLHAARRARACSGFGRALEYAVAGLRALAAAGLARPLSAAPDAAEAPRAAGAAPTAPPELEGAEFELTLIRAEAEYVFKCNLELAEALFERAAALARSRSDSLRVYRLRVALLSTMQRFRESCEAALEALAAFWGLPVDLRATLEDFARDVSALVAALAARCPAAALDPAAPSPAALAAAFAALPACASEETPELLRFGAEAALSAAYAQLPALFCVVPARCLLASLEAGRAPEQAVLFGILGHTCAILDALLPFAHPFAELCVRFGTTAADGRLQARSLCWAAMAGVWGHALGAALEFAEACVPLALQVGDLVDACLATSISVGIAVWACEPIPALERRAAAAIHLLQSCKQELYAVLVRALAEWPRILTRGPAAVETLSALPLLPRAGGGRAPFVFDAGRFERLLESLPCWLLGEYAAVTVCALLSLGDPRSAWRAVELLDARGVDLVHLRESFSSYQDAVFAVGLAAAARLSEGGAEAELQERLVGRLEGSAARYGPLAAASPRTYGPRLRAGPAGYEAAADAAAAEGYHFIVGVASERAASLAGAAGLERARGGYLRAAADAVRPGPAVPLRPVGRLSGASQRRRQSGGGESSSGPARSSSSDGDSLNWDSLVQASQCLLSEVHLPRLLERLVATVLEIAGAQR
eukprot:tig00000520_g1822.t1